MRKGEVWWVGLAETQGHEQKGDRPAIVLGKANNMVIAVPLTTNTERAILSHTLIIEPTPENGLETDSVALVFQIRSIDKARFRRKIGELTIGQIRAIDEMLVGMLGLGQLTL